MKIGLLGGTFNPIHIGHLAMGQVALENLSLDKVVYIPANIPPHKRSSVIASARDRFEMVKLAIKDNPKFEVSDIELKRGGKSYTVDTVKTFHTQYPDGTKFYFIVGGDLAETLPSWKNIDELRKLVSFVALNRPGFKIKQSKYRIKSITMPALEISSTFLRQCFSSGGSAKYLLQQRVVDYIQKHKLYGVK